MMAEVTMSESDRKLGELLLYVSKQLADEPSAGSTKVNKLLYFAEQTHLRTSGRPITGADYQRLEHGPAPRRLIPVRDHLVEAGDASIDEEVVLGRVQHRLVAQRPARLDLFDEAELASVDEVLDRLGSRSGRQLTDLSHEDPGWLMVDDGDTIPLEAAFIDPDARSRRAAHRARELSEQHKR